VKCEIEATDKTIDKLIYELYELTEEEDWDCERIIKYSTKGEGGTLSGAMKF
jgi:hypothetical protein